MRSWRVHMGTVVPKDQLTLFIQVLMRAILNSELTKSYNGFFSVIIGFIIQNNMGLQTKISYLYTNDPYTMITMITISINQ